VTHCVLSLSAGHDLQDVAEGAGGDLLPIDDALGGADEAAQDEALAAGVSTEQEGVPEGEGGDKDGDEDGEEESEDEEEEEEEEEEEDEDDEEEEDDEGKVKDEDVVDAEDQESLASEHDDDEEKEEEEEEEDAGVGAKGKSGKGGKRKKSGGENEEEEEEEKEKKKKQKKTLGLDARKIRKIKEVSGDAKVLQDREEERARWEKELRESGQTGNSFKQVDIINPFAEAGHQIRIDPVLARRLKPHQVEGVRFLWQRAMDGRDGKNQRGGLGSLAALEDGDKGAGCVLAHNMGLGKTFQVITFLHTIARNIPSSNIELRRMLVLGPVNTLQNWKAELERWIPDGGRLPGNRLMSIYILDEAGRTNKLRCDCLQALNPNL